MKTAQTKTEPNTRVRGGQTAGQESQRRGDHVKSEICRRASPSNTFQEESRGKTPLSEHPVAITTQEALDRIPRETMRVARVESNALTWMSTSSAGALDMTHCDFSVRSARGEMRHIIGCSEPDVIIGSDNRQRSEQGDARRRQIDHSRILV